ncbi:carbamoyltransferase HypF [Pseudonocardia nigra]|uniref:carbamoyltransferase HypF n=1 Tax=Pseudonocardia nigra TaxID=1921578 RepID=UPI001C5E3299|nr:carbamoyltransferase HypF [Pseudonocardia nigra]
MTVVRARIRVEGVVQGVGFRPFAHSLAMRLDLGGLVGNDSEGVFVEVEGDAAAVGEFQHALRRDAPPLAVIERVTAEECTPRGDRAFTIVASRAGPARHTLVSPDTATCAACLAELADPDDRRHGHPFLSCTHCGPRFTIVTDVPYDRPATTMAGFPMCAACAAEYSDPADRRFHAQPICCPACGPALRLLDADGGPRDGDPVAGAAALLTSGAVLAVKGLGGFHVAADATCEGAVAALRARKHREDKPFAVMVPDLDAARRLCAVDAAAESVLTSARRPIVLLPRRADAAVAQAVAPGNASLGLVLPYTPLHTLLAAALGRPFVLTSGNVSDEPIAYTDTDAAARLGGIVDATLTHDRPIHTRTDDSVVRLFRGREYPLRRSRGYVPHPLPLPSPAHRPVLACGAELKNTFCLARDRHAFVSHHIGDLENYETYRSFTEGIAHFRRLFDIVPEVVAHDLHPDYLSTKYARELDGVELVGVQHHHAHVASCLADNGVTGPVIGVALDGLGYGTDGTIWGGEFLLADLVGHRRLGHLDPVPMPGGAAAIRQPWRMAAAYLGAAYPEGLPDGLDVARRNSERWAPVAAMARSGLNSPLTSSAGRLFDAASAILGVRDAVNYEGQAAVELEQRADRAHRGSYPARLVGEDPFRVLGSDLVRGVADDVVAGVATGTVAARFHNGLTAAVVAGCRRAREVTGTTTVALSGGVWQNVLLLTSAVDALEAAGFAVLVHSRVPTNDGGISLGQAAIAAATHA